MTPKDELYQIAMELERFSEKVLREEPVKKLQAFVDRMMDVARRLDWHPTESDMRPLSTTGHAHDLEPDGGNLYRPHVMMINSGQFWRCAHGNTGYADDFRWVGCEECKKDDPKAYAEWLKDDPKAYNEKKA